MSTPTTTGTPWGRLIRETQIRFIRGRHPDHPGLGGWLPEYDELMPWQRAACDAEGAAVAAAVRAALAATLRDRIARLDATERDARLTPHTALAWSARRAAFCDVLGLIEEAPS